MTKIELSRHSMSLTVEANSLGNFHGVSSEDYHGDKLSYAYSKSDLDAVAISPANLIQRRNGPKADTKALKMGRMLHTRIEYFDNKERFDSLYQAAHKGTKKEDVEIKAQQNKDAYEKGLTLVDRDELEDVEIKLQAILAHPEASSFLKHSGVNEETFVWLDSETGLYCKCRSDRRLLEAPRGLPNNIIVDWKTIASPTDGNLLRSIEMSIDSRRYHVQAAFYLDGIKQTLGIDPGPFVNVFIEKGEQSRVICAVMSDEKIQEGRDLYKENLRKIKEAKDTNVWSGFVSVGKVWRPM